MARKADRAIVVPDHSIHPSLAGKAVLITGGAGGIGAAHVRAFAEQGARVAFLDTDANTGAQLVQALSTEDVPTPQFAVCDLTDISALETAIAAFAAEFGDFDVLVNNAANDQRHRLEDVDEAYFADRVAVNLKHLVFAAKALVPGMRRKGEGVILNTGSISWRAGFGGMPLYTMAKAGIEGLTRSLARDLGPDRIRVNCILPGWVMTERQLALWVDESAERMIAERQCLPDRVQPADIARMATWLASDDAKMCTNQTFVVDGGWI